MAYDRPILIIDDEDDILELYGEILETAGLKPLRLQDPTQAMGTIEREPVEVVILDVRMPGLDGVQLLKGIKAFEESLKRKIQVLIITAYPDQEQALQTLRDGAFCYLSKPVRPQDLLLSLRQAINALHPGRGDSIDVASIGLPQADAALTESEVDQVTCSEKLALEPYIVRKEAPERSGVVILRSAVGAPLYIEFADNIRRRLVYYTAKNPVRSEVLQKARSLDTGVSRYASLAYTKSNLADRAKFFEYYLTKEPTLAGQLFDKFVEILARLHPPVQPGHLGEHTDNAAHHDRLLNRIVPIDPGPPAGWLEDRGQHPDRRGLACAIGPKQTQDLSRAHVQVYPLDGEKVIKLLTQSFCANHVHLCAWQAPQDMLYSK